MCTYSKVKLCLIFVCFVDNFGKRHEKDLIRGQSCTLVQMPNIPLKILRSACFVEV